MNEAKVKFTPGPWAASTDGIITAADKRSVGYAAACRMDADDVVNNAGEATANARLIAAAPDLHKALALMVRHHSASPHIGVARAALAKAEGRL